MFCFALKVVTTAFLFINFVKKDFDICIDNPNFEALI